MVVHGSGMLARFLIEEQLVDKLTLLMYPVVLGIGKRLFADLKKTDLTLIESKPFASGIVLLQYEPKK
jgi:dihydrofolate reductase